MSFHVGVTGTRQGMTAQARASFARLARELHEAHGSVIWHHGDCVGVDRQADDIVRTRRLGRRISHPPLSDRFRAFCRTEVAMYPAGYYERDRAIVDACDLLIAVPKSRSSRQGGTWYTIGYARATGTEIWFVWPDGAVETPTGSRLP